MIEFADIGFPNLHFHAMAAARGHPHWLTPAVAIGDDPPLEGDLSVDYASSKMS